MTVVESQNITFLEPPPGVLRTDEDERHIEELARRVCTNDIMACSARRGSLERQSPEVA